MTTPPKVPWETLKNKRIETNQAIKDTFVFCAALADKELSTPHTLEQDFKRYHSKVVELSAWAREQALKEAV